jgi:dipeptidyl aminopeptidase/acylaminoacyl peptidase
MVCVAIILVVSILIFAYWEITPMIDYQHLLKRINGKIALVTSMDWSISLYENGSLKRLTPPEIMPTKLAWSPDGSSIAFIYQNDFLKTETYIGLIDMEKDQIQTVLQFNSGDGYRWDGLNLDLAWAPDGKSILFNSLSSDGVYVLHLLNLQTKRVQNITLSSGNQELSLGDPGYMSIEWSPGLLPLISTCVHNTTKYDCKIFSTTDNFSNSVYLTEGRSAKWLPTKEAISFYRIDGNDQYELYAYDLDERKTKLIGKGETYFGNWSPDGRYMVSVRNYDVGVSSVYIIIYDSKFNKTFRLFHPPTGAFPTWAPQ